MAKRINLCIMFKLNDVRDDTEPSGVGSFCHIFTTCLYEKEEIYTYTTCCILISDSTRKYLHFSSRMFALCSITCIPNIRFFHMRLFAKFCIEEIRIGRNRKTLETTFPSYRITFVRDIAQRTALNHCKNQFHL